MSLIYLFAHLITPSNTVFLVFKGYYEIFLWLKVRPSIEEHFLNAHFANSFKLDFGNI